MAGAESGNAYRPLTSDEITPHFRETLTFGQPAEVRKRIMSGYYSPERTEVRSKTYYLEEQELGVVEKRLEAKEIPQLKEIAA
jgi:hypothetical protein